MCLIDARVVVFDLDDTLYLERDYIQSGFQAVGHWLMAERAWPIQVATAFADACWRGFLSGRRGTIFNDCLADLPPTVRLPSVAELVAVYRAHLPRIQLLPDADTVLKQLRASHRLWIITDGPLVSQQAKLAALQLYDRVDGTLCTDAWGRSFWKPHPRAFQTVQQTTGACPHECVYIGDNPAKDFHAPRQLGWRTVRLRRPAGMHATMDNGDVVPCCEVAHLASLRFLPHNAVV